MNQNSQSFYQPNEEFKAEDSSQALSQNSSFNESDNENLQELPPISQNQQVKLLRELDEWKFKAKGLKRKLKILKKSCELVTRENEEKQKMQQSVSIMKENKLRP